MEQTGFRFATRCHTVPPVSSLAASPPARAPRPRHVHQRGAEVATRRGESAEDVDVLRVAQVVGWGRVPGPVVLKRNWAESDLRVWWYVYAFTFWRRVSLGRQSPQENHQTTGPSHRETIRPYWRRTDPQRPVVSGDSSRGWGADQSASEKTNKSTTRTGLSCASPASSSSISNLFGLHLAGCCV